jgi:two-component system nitrate/nitrite response regulator NarL
MSSEATRPVRILLLGERSGHPAAVLQAATDLGHAVVRKASDRAALAAITHGETFDVAIVVVGDDRERALDLIGELAPKANCPVIALLEAEDPAFLHRAARVGVFAYLTGVDVVGDRFASTIDIARQRYSEYRGRSGELRPHELTAREREILQLAAQGLPAKAIAHALTLSPSTVKTHFENIYAKWGVSDRASAVAKALREGLIR